MDVLSDVLQMIRLKGALFLNGEFHEPWCVDAPRGADFASILCPGAQNLAIVHMVLEGRCWIQLHGGEAMALGAGDVAMLPHGDAHLIGSGLRHAPIDLGHVVQVKLPELAPIRYGGQGDRAVLVCGWFAYEREVPNPLVAALPRMFSSCVGQRPSGPWIEQSIRYVMTQANSSQPGSGAVTAKVAESLFVEALRGYIETLSPQQTGWLAGLRDRQVGRCLALMHGDAAREWSLDALAQEVHSSRSVLAERFSELVGMPPMQYLKRWRLAIAARMLCNEGSSIARVAEAVGYESEASFSRAFKSAYGVAPGLWRSRAGSRVAQPDIGTGAAAALPH
jgi:AraC family transcriptional regulator, alkane utilization regulator